MKVLAFALAVTVTLAAPRLAAAQNTIKLLDPVNITWGTHGYIQVPPEEATEFLGKQIYLQCDAGATASIVGPFAGYGLIVDDFIRVQGPTNQTTDYCGVDHNCFGLPYGADPNLYAGQAAESIYQPVGPVDVSNSLVPGLGLYTFSLMDVAYTYTSSELSLVTSCAIKDKVCHFDSGKKTYKTLTLGAAAIPVHVGKHAGDFLGSCEEQ